MVPFRNLSASLVLALALATTIRAPASAQTVADFYAGRIHPRLRGGKLFSGTCAGAILIACLALVDLAQAQQAQSIFIEGDMVRGNTPKGQTGPTCVLNNQFKHNENAVFRVRVRDITGKPLDDKGIKGVVVELSDGQKLPMRYGGHPPRDSVDFFWSIDWLIPADYPLGTLRHKIVATDLAGRVQTWESFGDPRSQILIMPGGVDYSGTPQAPR